MSSLSFYQMIISRQWKKAKNAISEDPSLVNFIFSNGDTILINSLNEDTSCMTKFLLENGADVDLQDREGFTAIMRLFSNFHSYPKTLFESYLCVLISYPHNILIENNYGYNIRDVISLDIEAEEFLEDLRSRYN